MILAGLEYAEKQVPPGALGKAVRFLKRKDAAALSDGKVEIEGDKLFALIQRYTTVPADEPKFEYHRKYIDVQFIVSGAEVIGWAPAAQMKVTEPYNADKDVCFGSVKNGEWTPVSLRAGQLAVFYPEDAHAPKLAAGPPSPVMKIVVKVAL